jgi:hypothetical protein
MNSSDKSDENDQSKRHSHSINIDNILRDKASKISDIDVSQKLITKRATKKKDWDLVDDLVGSGSLFSDSLK